MIRYAFYFLAACVAVILEVTWLERLSVGAPVDPLLVLVIVVGLLHGAEEGALVGAGCGLLQDVMTGVPLGLGMLGGLGVGFCAGLAERSIYLENVWLPPLAAVTLTLLWHALWVGAAALVGWVHASVFEVARTAALGACYNGSIAVPIFHGLRRLDGALVRLYERPRS